MIPLLAASEKGRGRTESPVEKQAEMWFKLKLTYLVEVSWNGMQYRVKAS